MGFLIPARGLPTGNPMASFSESVPATLEGAGVCRFLERVRSCADIAGARAALEQSADLEPLLSLLSLREDRPVQAVLHRDQSCAVALCGWLPGQTGVVRERNGARSVYRVMRGAAVERRFRDDGSGRAVEVSCERYLAGSVVECEGDEAHSIANDAGAPSPLFTLHVFQPGVIPKALLLGKDDGR